MLPGEAMANVLETAYLSCGPDPLPDSKVPALHLTLNTGALITKYNRFLMLLGDLAHTNRAPRIHCATHATGGYR